MKKDYVMKFLLHSSSEVKAFGRSMEFNSFLVSAGWRWLPEQQTCWKGISKGMADPIEHCDSITWRD